MNDRIAIGGRDGMFNAYIARPTALPASAIVVLHEVFGVNADIRKTCDELAGEGFIAVAPDLFWRQEPGVGVPKPNRERAAILLGNGDPKMRNLA